MVISCNDADIFLLVALNLHARKTSSPNLGDSTDIRSRSTCRYQYIHEIYLSARGPIIQVNDYIQLLNFLLIQLWQGAKQKVTGREVCGI